METAPTHPAGPTLLGEYRRTARAARVGLLLWLAVFAGGLWCAIQIPGLPVPATGNGGYFLDPQAGDIYNWLWAGALGGLLGGLAGAARCVYSGWVVGPRTLTVDTAGFALQDRHGRTSYPWTAVTECRFARARYTPAGVTAGVPHEVTLRTADGRRWRFDSTYTGSGALATGLPLMTQGPVLTRTLGDWLAGRPVAFGAVHLDPAGLTAGRRTVAWDDLAGATAAGAYLTVWARDPRRLAGPPRVFARLPLRNLPNAPVLAQIVQALATNHHDGRWGRGGDLAGRRQAALALLRPEATPWRAWPQSVPRARPVRLSRRATIILGAFGLAALLAGLAFGLGGRAAAAELARFQAAPICRPPQTAGCREMIAATVVDWREESGRYSHYRYITIRLPDGSEREVEEVEGDLYARLRIDLPITAIRWQEQLVALADAGGHEAQTSDYPGVQATSDSGVALILAAIGFILLAGPVRAAWSARPGRRGPGPA